jgi:multidrug/hemolysin transport system permease protein
MVMVKRNIKLFFRDKSAVFFSLLAVLIIIGLYAIFLGDVMLQDESMKSLPNAKIIMYEWLFAGLMTVSSITASMGAFAIMIEDKTKGIDKDFYASPLSRGKITFGYVGGAFIVGSIITMITLIIAEAFIALQGGELLTPIKMLQAFGLLLLSALTSSAIMTFVIGFFKTQSQFGAASTIIGTLIGFITGIYLPIGNLPSYAQAVVKWFPLSHSAALFRQILMEGTLSESFAGAPVPIADEFREFFGVTLGVSPTISVAILVGTAVVFFALSAGAQRKR